MPYILDLPLIFWLGILAFILFIIQITTGILSHKGHHNLFKYHKINAVMLSIVVAAHVILALLLYL
jgi:hypothetical protein